MPLEEFERIGAARLLVGFTTDLASIGAAVRNFVHLFSGAAFLLASLAYLGWLSPERGGQSRRFCCFSPSRLPSCCANLREGMAAQRGAAWDRVVHVFRMVLDGVKQMKLNRTLGRQVLRDV